MEEPQKLLNKNYILLWQGQFVSKLGTALFSMATMLWIVEVIGSESVAGFLMASAGLVNMLAGPFAGTYADRHSRKRIILITDIINGIAVVAFAIATLTMPDRISFLVILLFFVTISNALLISYFIPAISAAIPDIVPKNKLAQANSMGQFSTRISSLLGMGLGGALIGWLGAPIIFLANGISYLFSAVSESFIRIPQKRQTPMSETGEIVKFKQDLIEGFQYVWRFKGLRATVLISAGLAFFTTPIMLLMAFFVKDYLIDGPNYQQWYGFIIASYSVGALFGYFAAALIRLDKHARARVLMAIIVINSVGLGVLGVMRNEWVVLAAALVLGLMEGYVNVNITTILQLTTPSEKRGRVFGVLGTLGGGLTPLAMALGGVSAELLNGNYPLIYFICGGAMTMISLAMIGVRAFREFLVYEDGKQQPLPDEVNPIVPDSLT